MKTLAASLFATLFCCGLAFAQGNEPAPAPVETRKEAPKDAAPAPDDGYVPYRAHDPKTVFVVRGPKEKRTLSIEGAALHALVDDLFAHARDYPPRFAKDEEKALAVREADGASKMLQIAIGDPKTKVDVRLLLDAARLEVCAHNLDVAGAATRARGYFERILEADPEHAQAHLHFGMHLLGLPGGAKDAVPHLQFAHEHGEAVALRGLGFAHLYLQDKEKALVHLRAWAKDHPDDEAAATMIEALESGVEIDVKHVDGDAKKEEKGKGETGEKKDGDAQGGEKPEPKVPGGRWLSVVRPLLGDRIRDREVRA